MYADHPSGLQKFGEGPARRLLPRRVEDPEGRAALLLEQREARDVGEAVADIDHVLEGDGAPVGGDVAIDQVWVLQRVLRLDALVDLEEVARLLGERDGAFDLRDAAGCGILG